MTWKYDPAAAYTHSKSGGDWRIRGHLVHIHHGYERHRQKNGYALWVPPDHLAIDSSRGGKPEKEVRGWRMTSPCFRELLLKLRMHGNEV